MNCRRSGPVGMSRKATTGILTFGQNDELKQEHHHELKQEHHHEPKQEHYGELKPQ